MATGQGCFRIVIVLGLQNGEPETPTPAIKIAGAAIGVNNCKNSALSGRQYHHHLPAFEPGLHLDFGDLESVILDAFQQFHSQLLVRHFAAAETQGNFDFIALLEEAFHRTHLHVIIVIIDHRSEFDLLDLNYFLLFARLGCLLLLLVFVFAIVEQLADGGRCIGRDFDQVQSGFLRQLQGFRDGNIPAVAAVLIDQMNFTGADLVINALAVLLDWRRGSARTTNGCYLLCCCNKPFTLPER